MLNDWVDSKRGEWIQRQERLGIPFESYEDLQTKEKAGEVMPYEQLLIPNLEEIKLEFREAIEDHIGAFNPDDFLFMKGSDKPAQIEREEVKETV